MTFANIGTYHRVDVSQGWQKRGKSSSIFTKDVSGNGGKHTPKPVLIEGACLIEGAGPLAQLERPDSRPEVQERKVGADHGWEAVPESAICIIEEIEERLLDFISTTSGLFEDNGGNRTGFANDKEVNSWMKSTVAFKAAAKRPQESWLPVLLKLGEHRPGAVRLFEKRSPAGRVEAPELYRLHMPFVLSQALAQEINVPPMLVNLRMVVVSETA